MVAGVRYMITALAHKVADFIYSSSDLSEDDRSIIAYGYEIIISTVITFGLLIITGLVFNKLLEIAVFFLFFYVLRQRTGGYHADTYFKCNLIFEINLIIVMLLCCVEFPPNWLFLFNILTFIACFVLILLKAPIENKNKPIPFESRKKHKITAMVLIVIFEILTLCVFNYLSFSFCITMAMASTAVAMIIKSR